jgi:hypothetical protein
MAAGIVGWRILRDSTERDDSARAADAHIVCGVLVGFFVGRILLIIVDAVLLVLSCAGGGKKAAARRREIQNNKPEGAADVRTPTMAEREVPRPTVVQDEGVQEDVAANASAREHGLEEAPPPYPGPRQELDARREIAEMK